MTVRSFALRQNPAYRPGISLFGPLAVVASTLGVACNTSVPRQTVQPPAPIPVATPASSSSWRPSPDLLAHSYSIEQRAQVTTLAGGVSSTDSTILLVDASLRRTPEGGVAGIVDGVRIGSSGARLRTPDGMPLPLAVVARPFSTGQSPTFNVSGAPALASCPSPVSSALGALRDLVMRMPDSLVVGTSWSDSGRATGCAGAGVLAIDAVRTYVVTGHVAAGVSDSVPDEHLIVRRTTHLTLSGEVARNADTTVISGQGTGALTFLVSTTTGNILAGSGTSTVNVSVRSTLREEIARQSAEIRVRRVR